MKQEKFKIIIHFVRNLILTTSCEFYYSDAAATSFINIKYGDIVTKIVPQCTACCYFFVSKKTYCKSDSLWDASVYGNKCFTKPTEHVWYKKMLESRNLHHILPRCNQSFYSGLDSSHRRPLHQYHSDAWQTGQMFARTRTICWIMKH